MRKIDFHIHTVVSSVDAQFSFCINKLKEYIDIANLDCIAITNHSLFDKDQFEQIVQQVNIPVFPGIEVDLEGGQILVISDGLNLHDFNEKCSIVHQLETDQCLIDTVKFKEIFGDLKNYILIPHYEKKPALKEATIKLLKDYITAGEVSSPKKFIYSNKNVDRLVPVYFSDCRIDKDMQSFPVRQTYIDCNDISFSAIKSCLSDKNKVSLSEKSGNRIFQVFDNGQTLSTGLNVILGERSSGKSHTLKKIHDSFNDGELNNVKFIEQFALVARDEKEDQERFDKVLSRKQSLFSDEYLRNVKKVVLEIIDVDLEQDQRDVSKYIESLINFAEHQDKQDSFSKATLFSEENFEIVDHTGLTELISSAEHLFKNKEYRAVIDKHIKSDQLKQLYVELMKIYYAKKSESLKQDWVNQVVNEVKKALQTKTASPIISDLNLYNVAMNRMKIDKFNTLISAARKPRELYRNPKGGYDIVANVGLFKGAGELLALSGRKVAFSKAYKKYGNPYEFLQALKKTDSSVEQADYYKFFVKIDYRILNSDGIKASGGERSEFFLLDEIGEAQSYDMLLIDEPESSFDNIFLKEDVNKIIKELSKTMPVVLVTHNNTVGASIKPDYLLYTKKDKEEEIIWRIYSGSPSDIELHSLDGQKVKTLDVFMGCLEGGSDTYRERAQNYENLKN